MLNLFKRQPGSGLLAALAVPLVLAGSVAAGCGSSDDSPATATQVTIPTITSPTVSIPSTTTPARSTQQAAAGATKPVVKNGQQSSSAGSDSDLAKARGGAPFSTGKSAPGGPSDAEKAENPGKYGGASGDSGPSDEQRAGG